MLNYQRLTSNSSKIRPNPSKSNRKITGKPHPLDPIFSGLAFERGPEAIGLASPRRPGYPVVWPNIVSNMEKSHRKTHLVHPCSPDRRATGGRGGHPFLRSGSLAETCQERLRKRRSYQDGALLALQGQAVASLHFVTRPGWLEDEGKAAVVAI